MKRLIYLIDGVGVPEKIYYRRQLWGEHPGAKFEIIEKENRDEADRSRGRNR